MKDYEPDDGPLTRDQIKQIRDKAKQADEIELVDFIRLAVLEEREACAQMLEEASKTGKIISCMSAAKAIRARGNK
jgi:hypothetical protein